MDQIKQGEVKVAYCPTENMLANLLLCHFKAHHPEKCVHSYLICPPLTRLATHTGVCWGKQKKLTWLKLKIKRGKKAI